MTAGISDVLGQFLFPVVHRNVARGEDVVEVHPPNAGQFRRLAFTQQLLRVKRHGQFQLEARFGLGGRDVQRLVDVVRNIERDAHGYLLHPFRRLVKPPASPARSMKVFGFTGAIGEKTYCLWILVWGEFYLYGPPKLDSRRNRWATN